MLINYAISQKAILVEEVEILSRELLRPVSSKDLLHRWKENPDRRPMLTQRVGQLLLKACRPNRRENPILFQVGVIDNLAFYAADQNPEWRKALRRHEIEERAQTHVRWAIPEHAVFLLDTEHDALAKNALAGFVAEWASVAENRSIVLPKRMHDLLNTARREATGRFDGTCPELLSREEARSILLEEMAARNPFYEGSTSTHRYLSLLRWPMSSMFGQTGYWELQIRQFCAARWPAEEDPMVAKARWLCGIYGYPGPLIRAISTECGCSF